MEKLQLLVTTKWHLSEQNFSRQMKELGKIIQKDGRVNVTVSSKQDQSIQIVPIPNKKNLVMGHSHSKQQWFWYR